MIPRIFRRRVSAECAAPPRPAPHRTPDPNGTRLDNRVRDRNTARATPRRWPRPIADHRFLRARPARPDGDRPEDTADPWPAPEFLDKKTLCIHNCVVLPDVTDDKGISRFLSQCTYRCVVLPDHELRKELLMSTAVSMHLQVCGAP